MLISNLSTRNTSSSSVASVFTNMLRKTPAVYDKDDSGGGAEKSSHPERRRKVLIYKLLKQACIVSTWFVLGLYVEVVGPTLPDLADIIKVDYEEIGRALSTKAIGCFVGSLVGGFVHEIFYRHTDLIMCLGLVTGAVGIGFLPHSRSLGIMAFLLSLTGFSEGILNSGGNTMVMHLWGEHAASPMYSTHFGFGVGAIIAPQIARPFLVDSTVAPDSTNVTTAANMTSLMMNSTTGSPFYTKPSSRLDYPYGIIAVVTAFVGFLMLVFYFKAPPEGFVGRTPPKLAFGTLLSPGTCSGGRPAYGTVLLVVLFVYFMHATGGERAYGKYLSTFAQESSLKFTKDQSANLASLFWACHVSGRFSGIVLSRWVPTRLIIAGDCVLIILTSVLLATSGYNNATALWILSGIAGFSISLFFPSGMAWANLQLDINSMVTMILIMGASIGGLVYQYLPGYLIEAVGTRSLMVVMVTYACIITLTFAAMTAIAKLWGERSKKAINVRSTDEGDDKDDVDNANSVML